MNAKLYTAVSGKVRECEMISKLGFKDAVSIKIKDEEWIVKDSEVMDENRLEEWKREEYYKKHKALFDAVRKAKTKNHSAIFRDNGFEPMAAKSAVRKALKMGIDLKNEQ